jgi:MFS family permease
MGQDRFQRLPNRHPRPGRSVTNFLAGQPTTTHSKGYNRTSAEQFREMNKRRQTFTQPPVVFLLSSFYKGSDDLNTALSHGVSIGPGVSVITGTVAANSSWKLASYPLYNPPDSVVSAAKAAATTQQTAFSNAGGPFTDPLHTLRVLVGLFFLAILPGLLAMPFFELEDRPSRLALVPAMSICMTLVTGIVVLSVWRGPLSTAKGWAVVVLACGAGAVLRFAREPIVGFLASIGNFFNKMMSVFSNRDYATLMGVQFAVQAAQGGIAAAIAKLIVFGGQKGFDVQTVPSAQYLLKVILALYVPYTILSPFIGVFIDRFERRRVLSVASLVAAVLVGLVAIGVMLPLGKKTSEGHPFATVGLVFGLLVAQAVVRVVLAAKSAAIPDVLSGRDLLQGNGLSQAGGALFQVLGIGFATGLAVLFPAWIVVMLGVGLLGVSASLSRKIQRMEVRAHEASLSQEARQVVSTIVNGLKEVASKPAAALGLSSFQMLRYQFWGFSLFVFALYARSLVAVGHKPETLALALVGGFGFVGGALGMILAQKYKDKIAPIRILLGAMVLLGAGTIVFGALVSKIGFALQLFVGFFAFFVGKISADTIMQQAIPDDFRGRAFALFDIAYNLGFIIPALILDLIWEDNRARPILIASGLVFLGLTFLISRWASNIKDQLSTSDQIATTADA